MPPDATLFVQALLAHGFTLDEAQEAAETIVSWEGERHPAYPCTTIMVLGRASYQVTADIKSEQLILKALVRL